MDKKLKLFDKTTLWSRAIMVLALILIVWMLAGCEQETVVPPTRPGPPPEILFNHPWVLLAYGSPENPTIVPKNTVVTIQFNQDGTLTGDSGCNQFSTKYEILPDGSLSISPEIVSTRMTCPVTQMEIETAFQNVLPGVNGFEVTAEERLLLPYATGTGETGQLVLSMSEVPLENTTWVLVSYGNSKTPQGVPPGLSITATFGADGKMSGFSGCNNYTAGYAIDGETITIGPVASTMMFCPDTMDTETVYLDALNAASSYSVTGPDLTLTTFNDQVLNFTSSALPLETTLWTLLSINGQPIPTGVSITAILMPDGAEGEVGQENSTGTISGSAGCNQYSAGYQVNGDLLTISDTILTMMACEEPIMTIESSYLTAMETVSAYSILGDTLEMTTADGSLLYSASRTPLTGALWVLKAMGNVNQPEAPITGSNFTIQFIRAPNAPTGVSSGTTGCNEYAASYTSNLTEIKINKPVSTGSTTCVPGLIDQEQVYFLALNDAVEYRILGDELIIPYDSGNQVLIFEAIQIGLETNIPLTSLDDTFWYLWTINNQPVARGTEITALFSIGEDGVSGKIDGTSGCNVYEATFGGGLSIETTLNSRHVCSQPPGVMEQEQAYLQILSRVYGFWLTGDQIILNSGLGTLTYRQSPAPQSDDQSHLLQANSWYLVSYNDFLSTPSEQGDPTVQFSPDGIVSGYTGCNEFQGKYTTELNQLHVSELVTTLAACRNNVYANQEQVMLDVLKNSQTYQVIDTALQIVSPQGVLNFYNQPVHEPGEPLAPMAQISAPQSAKVGQKVTFDASNSTSDNQITRYQWDFGDGGRGNGKVVQHEYSKPGKYKVQMTITDKRNYRDSDSAFIDIYKDSPPTPTATSIPPTPTSTVEPTQTPEQPEPAPTQTPEAPLPSPEPTATSETPPEPTATPETPPEATPTEPVEQQPPTAVISGASQGFPGEPVSFSAADSQPGSSPIATYQWNFGDGSQTQPIDQAVISTLYIHAGTYQVSVMVTDENGLSNTASTQVVIQARLDTAVWTLEQINERPIIQGTVITLQFLNGEIAGFSGCNTYTGTYTATQNEDGTYGVVVENVNQTRLACAKQIMEQEERYISLLTSTQTARIDISVLELTAPDGILVFREIGAPQPR